MPTTQFCNYPNSQSQAAILKYPTFGSFPSSATNGTLAMALDTDIIYAFSNNSDSWVSIARPTPVLDISNTSVQMSAGNVYISDNSSQVVLTLASSLSFGDTYQVIGRGSGGWQIAQNSGQQIVWTASVSTTLGTGGSLASTDQYDSIKLRAINSTQLVVEFVKGNITVT